MAHPFSLFQDCVDDNRGWWLDAHDYTPEHGKRAGVKAPPFNHWRDHVLLPALRLYRARLEGLPLASVPPVAYSLKRDGGIRSIRGFVFRTRPMPDSTDEVRCGDKFGPPRPLPADLHVCKPEDSQDVQTMDKMYSDALEPLLEEPATGTSSRGSSARVVLTSAPSARFQRRATRALRRHQTARLHGVPSGCATSERCKRSGTLPVKEQTSRLFGSHVRVFAVSSAVVCGGNLANVTGEVPVSRGQGKT